MMTNMWSSPRDEPFWTLLSGCNALEHTYIAIISQKQPTKVTDLLGYQGLIIEAYQEYQGDS